MRVLKASSLAFALAAVVTTAAAQTTVTNFFSGINKVVPDGNPTGVTDSQTLDLSSLFLYQVTDIQVNLQLSGGYNGDIYAYLVHDGGFAVLLNRVGKTSGNAFGYGDTGFNVTFSSSGSDIHNYGSIGHTFNGGGQLTGMWDVDGRNADPMSVLDTTARTSLLSSFDGTDPSGTWTLFLADMDFGQQSTLVNWGLVITAIPEPSSVALFGLGGLALWTFRRKRSAR
jgi:subtilisin-like proprotein convertase family protein